MAQYESIRAEINRHKQEIKLLEQEASEVLYRERPRAVEELKAMLRAFEAFNITAMDLGLATLNVPSASSPSVPKYRNRTTGETFSGKGKAPAWFDKTDALLINPEWLAKPNSSKAWKQAVSTTLTTQPADVAAELNGLNVSTAPAGGLGFNVEDETTASADGRSVSTASDLLDAVASEISI